MKTLTIEEKAQGYYEVLLPPCDTSSLKQILDPAIPYIWLIEHPLTDVYPLIEAQLLPLLAQIGRVDSVRIRNIQADLVLETQEFLRALAHFARTGIDLVQAANQIPRTFSLSALKPESRGRVFREVGIVLRFYLPHPHEYALLASSSKEVLERILSSLAKS